ncbi:AzlC family ABC transporter permease [Laribacter hongkongensis]|uniref:AzlC family ABC transporter permease n=1 Tax=Laribacter hongkongensis TaxID=168471 RepID=UPI001EFDD769|nr:AzlC family ABC transporter permease [Laribacter hongkongensis]MCG8996397.1 AzlC family ABC transporter permease [Laribacter hongkongensis]MCG9011227.1 AzlC family ABC transporter permease [Laribacter hongkongensis]MCG9023067.1 AzlC family ABC transporter permease [Laribacter hongkongensis]MCG9047660.1 AzlC family ABC transporter permease [Laribacter hongkongensis]MCG9075114.1 AzlC family ABC transporter permease [Laribacter hongkongensis]
MEATSLSAGVGPTAFDDMRAGIRRGFPIVLGYLPLGFAFGVLAVQNGIPGYAAVLMSILVFAGSGQFIAAAMWGAGAAPWAIIFTNLIINLRYLFMCAALAPWLSRFSRLRQVLFGYEITDEIFAVHSSAMHRHETARAPLVFAVNLTAHSGWVGGTLLGAVSGSLLADPRHLGLDFALPAMFFALLVPLCLTRLRLLVALLAGGLSVGFALLGTGNWNVILATLIGASVATWLTRKEDKA